MRRDLYNSDHELYRDTVRNFFQRDVVPHYEDWERGRIIDRGVYPLAARHGIFGLEIPEAYGGSGVADYRYRMIVCEESARVFTTSFNVTLGLFDDVVLRYLLELTTEEQKQRWLPGLASGERICAMAMTEPAAGSDLRGIRTTARRDGDAWILNGSKTFISCGTCADMVIVAARTGSGRSDFSLLVVEEGMEGFVRGRKLDKVGLHSQDTAELFFENVRVPAGNVIGDVGSGLSHMMFNLPRERLSVAAQSYTSARSIYEVTRSYASTRFAFGKPLVDQQHIRFVLAEIATELDVAEAYLDRSVSALDAASLTPVDAAKGKWYASELYKRTVDRCVQIFGGYGYMVESPVARAFIDSRASTIYAGTTEIMKEIIGRDLPDREVDGGEAAVASERA
ncbi:acyl-CoA dehydrogenase family protein [Nocardia sp. NBC_00508]|uniref:acyl-CoA dehydrogenase family protein n=1 Tax=Nocardia sp. NBC_00508 TaxID=2975992 RepID=UPI002E82099A|nr:acyl-CoA dehydrogenase family protein [Nocardia sp. NBC_00508]WUD67089.1 acyl-CoA dehydrogenase family protein [Nocardia sp. NBC_00508]